VTGVQTCALPISPGRAVSDRTTVEEVAQRAVTGDRDALDALVRAVQPDIYAVALRMLWNREDAEDATQEILVRVVTQLSSFSFRSRLKTWVYRVAVNHLLDRKRSAVERSEEHTSELQSPDHLVCRLLLEK